MVETGGAQGRPAIARIWRGRTNRERADEYERYNYEQGVKPLIEKAMGVQALREDRDDETEFVTISYWENVEAMAAFTGADPTGIHHLDRDPEFLLELPQSVQILEIRASHGQVGGDTDPTGTKNSSFPIISVENLPATQAFYEELGFSRTYRFPSDGDPVFVTMERGDSAIGIGAGGGPDEARFGLWVYVDDVDGTLDRLRASGAPVVAEPEEQPWGERVACTRDPGGHLVYLGAAR
jgi:catechol 2,3-dioxygenase-like lactoylglutathione lyase family enzyme/heme-degrading monooxygenase HmoA